MIISVLSLNLNLLCAVKSVVVSVLLLALQFQARSQALLGQTKQAIAKINKDCLAIDNYPGAMVFNCGGIKQYYYFQAKDSTCDLYARDFPPKQAQDTADYLLSHGFMQLETRYVSPFIVSKHPSSQKFPSRVYTDGRIEYCFMPVSLNGKTANLNAVVVMYRK